MANVGIYLRISDDRDGDQTATARQKKDCVAYAQRQGWKVADTFEDIDTSAFKRSSKRPEFERMLEAVRTKQIDGVLAWKIDRLSRRQRDLVRLDEACEDAAGFIATVTEGIDTRKPTGRFVAELLVAQARMESENSSLRIKRKAEERAASGAPNIGGTRPFGYTRDRKKIVQPEAALIREAVRRVVIGEGVRGVAFDWHRRGVVTPTGRAWTPTSLRNMLLSAALSGQRQLGQRLPEAQRGRLTPGNWPAVITPDESRRIHDIFNTRAGQRSPRKYLLVGIARCGVCREPLVARPRADKVARYVCGLLPGRPNCGKIARMTDPIDKFIIEAVAVALDGADLRRYVIKPTDDTAGVAVAIRSDEEAMQELSADYYTERKITRAEFFATRDTLSARLEANRKMLAKANGHDALHKYVGAGDEVRKMWDGQGLDWRRAVITAVIDHVVILPALKTGRAPFDPARIQIVWKF